MSMTVQLSLFVALIFIIFSSQPVYQRTTAVFKPLGLRLADSAGNSTRVGLVLHAVVVYAVVYAYARSNNI